MKLKIIISSIIIIALAVVLYFLFKRIDFFNIIRSSGAWAIPVYLIIYIISVIFLCFMPGTSMALITIAIALFGANYKTFLICFAGVIISSIIMDLIGRFGGSKLIIKLIGQDSYTHALDLLNTKGVVYVPVMYLLPIFPDDAICMAAGAIKVKWWIHYIEIILCRGIGCATIVFGVSILPEHLIKNIFNFNYVINNLYEYIIMLTVIIFWVIIMLNIAKHIDRWLTKRKEKRDNENKIK